MKRESIIKTLCVAFAFALFFTPMLVSCNDDDDGRIITADIVGEWTVTDYYGWYRVDNGEKIAIEYPEITTNYNITFQALDSKWSTNSEAAGPFAGSGTYWFSSGKHYITIATSGEAADTTTWRIHRLTALHFDISNSVERTYTENDETHTYESYERIKMAGVE